MLTFKRALIFAALLLTAFFFLRSSHTSNDPEPIAKPVAKPDSQSGFQAAAPINGDSTADSESLPPSDKGAASPPKQHVLKTPRPVVDTSQMSLYEKLAYQFPYDVETKFPAYIWQTWRRTPDSKKFEFRDEESSWTNLHPGFVHEVITDDVALHLLQVLYASAPEVLEAYIAMPEAVLKADFFRYLILFARGGIYSDIDTIALRSALDWIPEIVPRETYGLVVGVEADPDRPDWADWYSRRIQFCQWTIQAKAGHPVLRDIVTHITEEALKRKKQGVFISKEKSVMEFTGPAVWTDAIFNYFNDPRFFDLEDSDSNITWKDFTGMENSRKVGDVVVLPITSFSPGVRQMGAKDIEDPMAFVQHGFEGTWKPESERHIGEQNPRKIHGGS